MKLTVIGALTAFLAIATPAVLAAETFIPPPGSWWIGDELDTALPPRFTLNATSPKGELDGYSFIISTECTPTIHPQPSNVAQLTLVFY